MTLVLQTMLVMLRMHGQKRALAWLPKGTAGLTAAFQCSFPGVIDNLAVIQAARSACAGRASSGGHGEEGRHGLEYLHVCCVGGGAAVSEALLLALPLAYWRLSRRAGQRRQRLQVRSSQVPEDERPGTQDSSLPRKHASVARAIGTSSSSSDSCYAKMGRVCIRGAAEVALEGEATASLQAIARTAKHRLERGIWTSPGAGGPLSYTSLSSN